MLSLSQIWNIESKNKVGYNAKPTVNPHFGPETGSNGVKSEFSPDFNDICTRGAFLLLKKGYRVRFLGNAVFDPILALKRGLI